jgi:hypothetical protein
MHARLRLILTSALILVACVWTVFWQITKPPPILPGPQYRRYGTSAPLPESDYAVATFLTGQGNNDAYFIATRTISYSLLHAPDTKFNDSAIPFLVICSESVPDEQKDRLVKDGATVLSVRDVPVNWWIHSGVQRWKEQFTKLRVFEITEYKRILFMDADTMVMKPVDGIFEELEVQTMSPTLRDRKKEIKSDESALPDEWYFASRSDNDLAGMHFRTLKSLLVDVANLIP